MPKKCPHFRFLTARIQKLTTKFLKNELKKETQDPIGFDPDLDKLAAFRLLVHAEIEDFLESKARSNIDNIARASTAGVTWMRNFPELFSIAYVLRKVLPEFDATDSAKMTLYISDLITSARTAIKENNGVKANSFSTLSALSGKPIDEIDQGLSASLNSFGKNRGDVAHQSVAHSRGIQAPSSELQIVTDLIKQLKLYYAC